jgi:hypothetical protein
MREHGVQGGGACSQAELRGQMVAGGESGVARGSTQARKGWRSFEEGQGSPVRVLIPLN